MMTSILTHWVRSSPHPVSFLLCAVLTVAALSAPPVSARTWTDHTGKHQIAGSAKAGRPIRTEHSARPAHGREND